MCLCKCTASSHDDTCSTGLCLNLFANPVVSNFATNAWTDQPNDQI